MGTQALQVMDQFPDLFEVELLSANSNSDLLIQQAIKYKPNVVVIIDEQHYEKVKNALAKEDCKVFAGLQSLVDCMSMNSIDMALSCIVGIAGLAPVYSAIENEIPVALANKETLVVAGELMMQKAREKNVPIIPVDSEHSAIFQCLIGEHGNVVEKIILTASGGPFRGKTMAELEKVTCEQALKHPNWNMGNKITIDSATLMNKGLEVIEAKWLFNIDLDKIEVIVHPQSIIHSLVQFTDGSIKAQLGLPDMKLPIQYALTFPQRLTSEFPRFSFADFSTFTFEDPDMETFPCLSLAYHASKEGGNKPCVLNAANEVAVAQFLNEKIKFTDISRIIEKALSNIPFSRPRTIEEYLEVDREVKEMF
ncbi:MAG: 1-deoxy-D-xylulose-5-phosphate reductoisomerase [Bacteroidetes bacterium]|nr:1-deoxy-D-xylulose-5-phosphate reductoisomerase [Bacteroidota bacterium]MCL2301689.1 1-deoxy-D-xylulose-5-phosphate reductoisomerase [Lentimicrobiaceae bacterium]